MVFGIKYEKGINNMVKAGDLLVARKTYRKIKGTNERYPFVPCYVSDIGENDDEEKIFEVTYIEKPEIKQWIHPEQRERLWNFM